MKKKHSPIRSFRFVIMGLLMLILRVNLLAQDDHVRHQTFPHPVNATMGIPDPVGSYNIWLNLFRQQTDSGSEYDLSGHLGYGMFEWGGIHLRSLGVKTTPFTEIIGMVGLWRDESQQQGVSFLGILGVPTGKKGGKEHHGIAYLAGLAARVNAFGVTTNDVIAHYDFSTGHFIAESGSVIGLLPNVFGIVETSGTFGSSRPNITMLSAIKVLIIPSTFVSIGYRFPVSTQREFRNQVYLQVEVSHH